MSTAEKHLNLAENERNGSFKEAAKVYTDCIIYSVVQTRECIHIWVVGSAIQSVK